PTRTHRRLPPATDRLDDPLEAIERAIAGLESADALAAERAEAWMKLAVAWLRELGAMEEATRAYREAAAADPTNVEALRLAMTSCAAMGELRLACAYGEACVAASTNASERARLLQELGDVQDRAGILDEATATYRRACVLSPTDADLHHRLALLHLRGGSRDEAVASARRAAGLLREEAPTRARALLRFAQQLSPSDLEWIREEARLLMNEELGEAAATLLASEARLATSPEERRALILDAASFAEQAGRSDIAFDRLLEAFDAEPEAKLLHAPLAHHAAAGASEAEQAVVLEAIAYATAPAERSRWLLRSGEIFARVPGGLEWGLELLSRALAADPAEPDALEALRVQARQSGDFSSLADALERAIRATMGSRAEESIGLLEELMRIADEELDEPSRALWAAAALEALRPDSPEISRRLEELGTRADVRRGLLDLAFEKLEGASGADALRAARRVATLLRGDPSERRRAIEFYDRSVDADPDDDAAASALERLLRLEGDEDALVDLLQLRLRRASSDSQRVRLLSWLAGLEAQRGHARAAADASLALLEIEPRLELAQARLHRAARALGDPDLYRSAHATHLDTADAATRGRALTALALLDAREGHAGPAARRAAEALAADPRAAGAAGVILSYADHLEPTAALAALMAARRAAGDSPELLRICIKAAEACGDLEAVDSLLRALQSIAPLPGKVALDAMRIALAGQDRGRIIAAAEQAMAIEALDDKTPGLVRDAIARFEALGAQDEAASLAVRAIDRIGERARDLLLRADELAARSSSRKLQLAALERRIAWSNGQDKLDALRRLAQVHSLRGDLAAEVRALIRVLAVRPQDPKTLERLTFLFAQTGEHDRLMAVLSLRLETSPDPQSRHERLRDLAAASLRAPGGEARAEAFLRVIDEEGGERVRLTDDIEELLRGEPRDVIGRLVSSARTAPPDDAALLFERAVLLALNVAEDARLALEVCIEGLRLLPSSGGLLLLFERLALEAREVGLAQRTYAHMVAAAMGNNGRRALRYREARWLQKAEAPAAALRAYRQAFTLTPGPGVIVRAIESLAETLGEWGTLVQTYRDLAEHSQHVDRKLALYRSAAEIVARRLEDPAGAFELLMGLWGKTGRSELLLDLRRLASQIAETDPAAGEQARLGMIDVLRKRVEDSWVESDQVRSLRQIAAIHIEDRRAAQDGVATVQEAVKIGVDSGEVEAETLAGFLCDAAGWLDAIGRRGEAGMLIEEAAGLDPKSDRVRSMSKRFDAGAAIRSAEAELDAGADVEEVEARALALLAGGEFAEAARLLRTICLADPARVSALQALHAAALGARMLDLSEVSAAILSRFDAAFQPPEELGLEDLSRSIDEPMSLIRDSEDPTHRELLTMLWAGTRSAHLRDLAAIGAEGAIRITPQTTGIVGQATADVQRVLHPEGIDLYLGGNADSKVEIITSDPPAILLGHSASKDLDRLRFRLGRAFELAQPGHLLLSALSPEEGEALLGAVEASFGAQAAPLSAELAELIPEAIQAVLRRLLGSGVHFAYEELAEAVHARSARAGLLVCGKLGPSIDALLLDDPSLRGLTLETESDFAEAAWRSGALRELLRFSLSDEFLAARARARSE
ncbi:MAG: hypothetical protein OEY14_04045, partial [Myxococcales bacterium]|nr:hypothetical protein [Myxococcales bacterium]